MDDQFARTRLLLGSESLDRLRRCRVAVFGLGGVGGYAAEALCRSGVGALELVDPDTLSLSNLNRQILALHSTLGMNKAEAAARRLVDINPNCQIVAHKVFYLPGENDSAFDFSRFDYVVDAIDTVTGKIGLAVACAGAGTPLISAMGTGNKLDPTALRVADLSKTSMCPLARVMRKELRKRGIEHLKVVYSPEEPLPPLEKPEETPSPGRRSIPGSTAFVPAAAGLILAAEVVRDLTAHTRGR